MFSMSDSLFFIAITLFIILNGCGSPNSADDSSKEYPVNFTHEIVTDELNIPWQMDFASDGRVFITERDGYIRIVKDDQLIEEPWFDFNKLLNDEGESFPPSAGVQGIALDPNFDENGYVYVGYAYASENNPYDLNKLVRLKEDPHTKKGIFDKVLLSNIQGLQLHNGAQVKFGPDDKIYWSIGDQFIPDIAQDLDNESGSILRLNPDGSIPSDNPIPNNYIYSYGHRNPQGFSWHPDTELMLATEHGPSTNQGCCHDEINIIKAGYNYGWPEIRGDESLPEMESPLIHSGIGEPHGEFTWAPSGATFVNKGPWKGTFLFGGLRSQSLWQLKLDENNEVKELKRHLFNEYYRTRSVAQDKDGYIYLITSNIATNHPYGKDVLVRLNVFYDETGEK